jgi:dimethylargininase
MLIALTREVSPNISQCELTHLERVPIDYDTACAQHEEYLAALRSLGLEVQSLPAEPDLPDSVFVEDTAIVLDEVAVITRPGADSRKPETESIARALTPYRELRWIESPATLDGGDVLLLGKTLRVGLSGRSNPQAIEQLRKLLNPFGYVVWGANIKGALHLKTGITQVAVDTLLINPAMVEKSDFAGWKLIEVDPSEPMAGNALLVEGRVIYPKAYPRTQARLEAAGIEVVPVNAAELAKAEGGVTCCSLIFEGQAA